MPSPFDPSRMGARLLVSVRCADEAAEAARAGADLVDAKDPDLGALGALPPAIVRAIADAAAGRAAVSAVAGEPCDAEALAARVAAMAATGVDYVKVAVRPDFPANALARAAAAAPGRLIAVLFAEGGAAPELIPRLAEAGFCGAMIDTAGKDGRRLTDFVDARSLFAFTAACRARGLISGLAGSLAIADIPALAPLGADYLGFRGGLCRDGDRRLSLDSERLALAVAALRASARRGRGVMRRSVVKVGGSLVADYARLRALLSDLAEARDGPCVIVPGGGPFADAVRVSQGALGFSDSLAHRLALDAMARMAEVFCEIEPRLRVAESLEAIEAARATPVWSPVALKKRRGDIPESWSVTSDSLALWLAIAARAPLCVLVKSVASPAGADAAELARLGIVDAAFPDFAARYLGEIVIRGPGAPRARAAA